MTEQTTIAVLGMGAMGARMAHKLLDAGHRLVVYNRSPQRCAPLVERGAVLAKTPAQAAAQAQILLSVVTDDDASRQIWTDPDQGALRHVQSGALLIESSTLTRGWVEALAAQAADRGLDFLDAPVAGSRPQAEAGALIHLVGGHPDAVARGRCVLQTLGQAIHHVGPAGASTSMKLAVNALFGIQVAALAETLGALSQHGINPQAATEVLGQMPITSPALVGIGRLMAASTFAPLFPIDLVEKDFRCALTHAAAVQAPTPITAAAQQAYARAQHQGLGQLNIHAILKAYHPGDR